VFRLERRRTVGGRTTTEIAYGITSLTPERASPERLLALSRGHWGIENSLHYVRDVTLGEDACRIRSGTAPQVFAALRNLLVRCLRALRPRSYAAALRRFAARPGEAARLLTERREN
jgi:hypothetical protein